MPAPATSSRHLYTGHRQDSHQAASWPTATRPAGAPSSRGLCNSPVSMSSFAVSMRQQWFTHVRLLCRTPDRSQRPFPQRSQPRLFTGAACGGLGPPPDRRSRRANLHHQHSTVHDNDLLHRHHSPFRTHCRFGVMALARPCVGRVHNAPHIPAWLSKWQPARRSARAARLLTDGPIALS
jgi:hypothetical protein